MGNKRGMSGEEKRNVILKIYHEHKAPFNLKEIETLASKAGVVLQSVKEFNQSLVDDNMVYSDKIGSANFFWSFPSKEQADKTNRKEQTQKMITHNKELRDKFNSEFDKGKENRNQDGREEKMMRFNSIQLDESRYDEVLLAGKENDPEEIQKIRDHCSICKAASERWTDNVFQMKKYLTKSRGFSGKEADKNLGITAEYDYVVHKPKKAK